MYVGIHKEKRDLPAIFDKLKLPDMIVLRVQWLENAFGETFAVKLLIWKYPNVRNVNVLPVLQNVQKNKFKNMWQFCK